MIRFSDQDPSGSQVGIPYVKAKLKDLYERLGGGLDPEIARARRENDPRGSVSPDSIHLFSQLTSSTHLYSTISTSIARPAPRRRTDNLYQITPEEPLDEALQAVLPLPRPGLRSARGRVRCEIRVHTEGRVEVVDEAREGRGGTG